RKERVVFSFALLQKISTLFALLHPCKTFFGSSFDGTKPIHPKATIRDHRLELVIIRAEPLVIRFEISLTKLIEYVICGVSSPHDELASTPKVNKNLHLKPFILFFKRLFLFLRQNSIVLDLHPLKRILRRLNDI
ncbi:hypothetical protein, partial [Bacillus cereus group sp. N21]|uniref:hypothetical protein n=1 Tax=Bacillus cereus group sp. N21 TaxID=2794591 RepID=UPI001A7E4F7A